MTSTVVAKTEAITADLRLVAAIELIAGAQAVDLAGVAGEMLGRGARDAYEAVRARVAALDEDRPLGPDIDAIATLVAGGEPGLASLL